MIQTEENKNSIFKFAFLSACGVLLIYILWSVVTETLIPLYNAKIYDEFIYNLLGVPLTIFGTCVFAFGGWVFVRDTARELLQNEKISDNLEIIKDKENQSDKIKAAKIENSKFLLKAWKKGSLFMLFGAISISAGGILINLKKILE